MMAVKRVVANIAAADPAAARAFYGDVLGMAVVMDQGWILTFAALGASVTPQVSVAREGGSGTAVPDLSVEVDDLDPARKRVDAAWLSALTDAMPVQVEASADLVRRMREDGAGGPHLP